MAKVKDFSGNKGEWSEPYVVLKLLADGRLSQADDVMLPSKIDFANIHAVFRGDLEAEILSDGVVVFSHVDELGMHHNTQTSQEKLAMHATRLFKSICVLSSKKKSSISSEASVLKFYGFKRLTNPAPKELKVTKRDMGVKLSSPKLGVATLGFSVKSEIGAPPTLLNASEPTNIVYRVKGLSCTQADAINKIDGSRKIMDRCRAIKNAASSIEYDGYHSSVFEDNLDIVDSALPKMLADLVKVHYFEQILIPRGKRVKGEFRPHDKLVRAVELLERQPDYATKKKRYCEIKIKRFLRACALGLMPSEEWAGIDDASGGYIIVLPDGQLVALYVYNTNLFEKYLYESTIFERASTTRHKYLTLYPDGNSGDYLLKLNLQIRFNR